jgi:4-hydroxy-2-oxoheptanedioate aldolase
MENHVLKRHKVGRVSVGVWLEMMNPELVELCGWLGFQYAVIDAEHFAVDLQTCVGLVRACEVSGMVPIVRVPYNHPGIVLSFLETGVLGIYVPHVNSADEARSIVDAVKYPPLGHRGAGSGRYLRYGIDARGHGDDQKDLNENTMVITLLEDLRGVANLEDVMAVEGVDAASVGMGDLANSMGYVGQKTHPAVTEAVLNAEARIVRSGRALECVVANSDEAVDAVSRGATMISVSVRSVLKTALGQTLDSVRDPGTAAE